MKKTFELEKKIEERKEYMRVMTPAFESMNSSYAVSSSTRDTIISSFRQIHAKIQQALEMDSPVVDLKSVWGNVFKPFNFFKSYD